MRGRGPPQGMMRGPPPGGYGGGGYGGGGYGGYQGKFVCRA